MCCVAVCVCVHAVTAFVREGVRAACVCVRPRHATRAVQ